MSEVRRPSGSAATRPRRFYVGTNLYGTGCNIGVELARDAAATADDWRWAIGRILGAEEAERRPRGFPPAPVTVAALAVYDDASGVWGPLPADLAALDDGTQLWAFQAPNPLHSELSIPLPSPADGVSPASFVALRRVFFRAAAASATAEGAAAAAAAAAKTASKRALESRFIRAGLPSPVTLVGPQQWSDAGGSPHVVYAEWETLCLGTPALLEAASELAAGEVDEVRSPPATPAPKWPPTAHQQRQHATAALLRSASASASVATAAGPSSRASSTAEAGGGTHGAAAQQEEAEPEVVYSQLLLGDGGGVAGRRRSGAAATAEPEWPSRARRQSIATTEPADSPKEEAARGRGAGGVEEAEEEEEGCEGDLAPALSRVRSRRLSLQSREGEVDELSSATAAAAAAAAAAATPLANAGVGRAGSAAVLSMASSPGVSPQLAPHDASGLALRSVSRASFVSDAACVGPTSVVPPLRRHEASQPPSRAATPASGAAGEAEAAGSAHGGQRREESKVRWGDEFDLLEQQIAAARLRRQSLEMDCAWTEPRKSEQP